MVDRTKFYSMIRSTVFGGRMTAKQVEGVTKICEYRDTNWPRMPDSELAYVLATAFWETGRTMQPICEMGSQNYLKSKPYYPFFGRGLCQLTWAANYKAWGCYDKPEKALEWPTALDVIFRGMIFGRFTGKKLSDYIGSGRADYVGARRIINGTDKATTIAGFANSFRAALPYWVADKTMRAAPPEPTNIFGKIGDFVHSMFDDQEKAAVQDAPMPPPTPGALTGSKAYTLSAIVAAIGALQLIDWQQVVEHPEIGYSLILSAVGTAVARAVLPTWLQWIVIK